MQYDDLSKWMGQIHSLCSSKMKLSHFKENPPSAIWLPSQVILQAYHEGRRVKKKVSIKLMQKRSLHLSYVRLPKWSRMSKGQRSSLHQRQFHSPSTCANPAHWRLCVQPIPTSPPIICSQPSCIASHMYPRRWGRVCHALIVAQHTPSSDERSCRSVLGIQHRQCWSMS